MKPNRILALLLVWMLVVSFWAVPAFAQNVEETEEASEEVVISDIAQLLHRLDILAITEAYNPNAEVLRADFLKMVLKAIGVEAIMTEENRQIFFDVEPDAEIAPMVQTAYNLGIIKGKADGRFCPDVPITSVEALIMTVRAAGCESIALEEGGYWSGYLICGKKFGFTEYLTVNDEKPMKNPEAEQMIYNLLNAKTLNITSNGLVLNKNTSLLQDLYHVTEARGVVDANSVSNIYGAGRCENGRISINNRIYDIDMEFDGKFLGENVVFYYQSNKNSDRNKIVYMYAEDTEIYEIEVEDVVSLLPGALNYYGSNGTLKQIPLAPDTVTLENGVKVSVPEQGYPLPKYGRIKVVKAERTNVATVTMIASMQFGIVKNVNEEVLYLEGKQAFQYDTGLYEKVIIKNGDGNTMALTDIPRQSLVESYAAADKSRIELVVLDQTRPVTVTNLREIADVYPYYEFADADGTQYRTIRDFKNFYSENKIEAGSTYTALLDSNGYVAAFVSRSGQYRYGYLYKSTEVLGNFDTTALLKMYTDVGAFEEIPLADKVENVGADNTMTAEAMLALCAEGQVIKYALNSEGEISAIAFAKDDTRAEGFRKAGTTPENSYNETTRYRKDTKLFGGLFALDNNTVIFEIPQDNKEEERFHVLKPEEIVNEGYYPGAQGYADDDSVFAKAIVIESVPRVERDSARMLVTAVAQIYNGETGKQETALMGLVDGKEKTISLVDETVLNCIVRETNTADDRTVTVAAGDVIRYALDWEGKISQVLIAFDYSAQKVYGQRKTATNASDGSSYIYQIADGDIDLAWGADAVHAYGTVNRIQDGAYLRFQWDGAMEEKAYAYPVMEGTTYIYTYDASEKESARAKVATVHDIVSMEDNPLSTDKVVMLTRLGAVPLVVVYK